MASTSLAINFPTLTPKFLHNHLTKPASSLHYGSNSNGNSNNKVSFTCKATSGASRNDVREYDLYELMGIERNSDQSEIKRAYRSLQKKCHPDIAGVSGHDMSIILNDAYALLSDPVARSAYDKEQAKLTEFQGYTGQPLYSTWMGSETEEKAVFVDEVKCIGCLKCALLANKTFAIESAYGRARVVAQWADPEDKIQESIDVCPVNCISLVERSDLAALEFLMSKQPRGTVKIGASNTAGARSFDVFSEVKFFHKRLEEAAARKSKRDSKYSNVQSDARMSAFQAIRSISNWLYWQTPVSETPLKLVLVNAKRSVHPDVEKQKEAAAEARKRGTFQTRKATSLRHQPTLNDEYWTPSTPVQAKTSNPDTTTQTPSPSSTYSRAQERTYVKRRNYQRRPLMALLPLGFAVLASINAFLHGAGESVGGLDEHVGGSFALVLVNSSWLPVILAGVPWYLVGIIVERLIDGFSSKDSM